MIRAEVASALAVLDAGKSYPQKLAYALAKGRIQLKRLAREIEAHRADAYTPEVLDYIRGRDALGLEHAAKGEDGNPVMQPTGWKLADPHAYTSARLVYEAKHADAKASFEVQDRAFRDWLSEEVEITTYVVDPFLVPEDLSIEEAEVFMVLLAWEG